MIERCLTGTVLILAIALFRMITARRIPKRILCVLWIAATLYLLIPIRIPSSFNVYSLLPKARPAELAVTGAGMFRRTAGAPSASVPNHEDPNRLVFLIYKAVCAAFGLWMFSAYVIGTIRLHSGKQNTSPYIEKWRVQHPLHRPLRILESDRVSVPISGGLLFPVILLPSDRRNCKERELECILTHEYLHVCHFDALWKLLLSACLCLFWFHPAVWLMVLLAERDIEYACDEAVLATGIRPRDYGSSLIRMELRKSDRPALSNSFVAGRLLHRVNRITDGSVRKPISWVAGAILAGLILAFFATGPIRSADTSAGEAALPARTVQSVSTAPVQPTERAAGAVKTLPISGITMSIDEPSLPDPYYSYQLLGEMKDVPLNEVEAASATLKQQYSPYLLRITSTANGGISDLRGISVHIQVYDFPERDGAH